MSEKKRAKFHNLLDYAAGCLQGNINFGNPVVREFCDANGITNTSLSIRDAKVDADGISPYTMLTLAVKKSYKLGPPTPLDENQVRWFENRVGARLKLLEVRPDPDGRGGYLYYALCPAATQKDLKRFYPHWGDDDDPYWTGGHWSNETEAY